MHNHLKPVFCFIDNALNCVFAGTKYKYECAVEPMIPIYLIVAGAGGVVVECCSYGTRYQEGAQREERWVNAVLQLLVQPFIFFWFVFGNLWIYRNYEPNYADPESADYTVTRHCTCLLIELPTLTT